MNGSDEQTDPRPALRVSLTPDLGARIAELALMAHISASTVTCILLRQAFIHIDAALDARTNLGGPE